MKATPAPAQARYAAARRQRVPNSFYHASHARVRLARPAVVVVASARHACSTITYFQRLYAFRHGDRRAQEWRAHKSKMI